MKRRALSFVVTACAIAWLAVIAVRRPSAPVTLVGTALGIAGLWYHGRRSGRRAWVPWVAGATWLGAAVVCPHVPTTGYGRYYADQTYHHQVLRALHHAAVTGGDLTEVLEATRTVEAGDADAWFAAWTALGDRNRARADATRDTLSRGRALLRAHTYYLRAEFFLPPHDPRRKDSYARNQAAFYEGLDNLAVPYEKLTVPFESSHLNALYYPDDAGQGRPLILFCGGSDTTLEELYFFLVAAARERHFSVLTFEGPGQGAVLREQGLTMTPEWERPTAATLDAFLSTHARPSKIVMVGLSMGGYLAARAAAYEPRIDGVVSYDVFFDGREVARRQLPMPARWLETAGLGRVVDTLAPLQARLDPAAAWSLQTGGWILGEDGPTAIGKALSAYRLEEVAPLIHQDVLAFAGADDQFVPRNQIDAYRKALTNARSVTTKIYDRASGGAEHSQLGAATLWEADLFDWIADKFPAAK